MIAPGVRDWRDGLAKGLAEGRVARGPVQLAACRILSALAWCLKNRA